MSLLCLVYFFESQVEIRNFRLANVVYPSWEVEKQARGFLFKVLIDKVVRHASSKCFVLCATW